ncbi:MAG: molybdenum cofactor guanylyltransferase, partial [Planctomycetota bacterium]
PARRADEHLLGGVASPVTGRQSRIAGVVLAGGQSARMGRDKARLRLGEQTLLERTTGLLCKLFDEVLVVVDRADRIGAARGARVVEDLVPRIGPLGGIYTALMTTERPAVFVVACDMPRLDARVISDQLRPWEPADADALVPLVEGRAEPLHAVYSRRCVPAIERRIEQRDYRVRAFFEAVRVRFWEPGPAAASSFANVNTPEDWAAIVESGGDRGC